MEENKSEITWVDTGYLLLETFIHMHEFKDKYLGHLEITKLKATFEDYMFCKTEDLNYRGEPGELMYDDGEDHISYILSNEVIYEWTIYNRDLLIFEDDQTGRTIRGTEEEVAEYKQKLKDLYEQSN